MTPITLEFLNQKIPRAQTFESPFALQQEIKSYWKKYERFICPEQSIWEYLHKDTRVFFGEHYLSVKGDNSTFVEGYRCSDNTYEILYGVPALYKTYTFKNAKTFFRNGIRLRKLVDRLGERQTLELLRNK